MDCAVMLEMAVLWAHNCGVVIARSAATEAIYFLEVANSESKATTESTLMRYDD